MLSIYLSGPIMDECEGVAREWRAVAARELGTEFAILDPMRRNFKDREVDSANEIVEFDLQDVRDADLLLVNYSKPSIGTAMEVFYAAHDLGLGVPAGGIGWKPNAEVAAAWPHRHCHARHTDADALHQQSRPY